MSLSIVQYTVDHVFNTTKVANKNLPCSSSVCVVLRVVLGLSSPRNTQRADLLIEYYDTTHRAEMKFTKSRSSGRRSCFNMPYQAARTTTTLAPKRNGIAKRDWRHCAAA